MAKFEIYHGCGKRLGAIHDGAGVNFAVFSQNAIKIELCIFSANGMHEIGKLVLPARSGAIWHGYVPKLPVGTLYGYRAHGEYTPQNGMRFNANKLLMDPYTREISGQWINDPALMGYEGDSEEEDLSFSTTDSAPFVPKSVVSDPALFQLLAHDNCKSGERGLIYEAHVKGLTKTHPKIRNELRGTYEGLASDEIIEHLLGLGVGAIELMPVHSFMDDKFLLERKLSNYWGYNTIGFFAPEPRYFGPQGLIGFRSMVDKFKANGISVILDVVYNHTAEGDQRGVTICYRGLDNSSYYRLNTGDPRYYVNDTGCGNCLDVSHPIVLRMVMDSLRFWVQIMGVDGFRFDLATSLGREAHGFDINGGFFDALGQDPVLCGVKLIAEPWDIGPGGYRLGEFPSEFLEWNDQFRDKVRKYWRADEHSTQALAACLLGSAEYFDQTGRSAQSSVNFIASHDGFTLKDICSYNERHNQANGEENRDGHHSNFSDNFGIEGPSDDEKINAMRSRRQRNMLAMVFLSQGTPMLLAGDEMGNSQSGNNNAYCQDNEISWLDWANLDAQLLEFVRFISAFRNSHRLFKQSRFLHGDKRLDDGKLDVEWSNFAGDKPGWHDYEISNFCLTLRASARAAEYDNSEDAIFIVVNREKQASGVKLPERDQDKYWHKCIDTAKTTQHAAKKIIDNTVIIEGNSVVAFALMLDENK